ncbi:hypothetical protein DPMN_019051 [Dreissena polymorpha]|uniref:Uncharacterized protein n=1 Tax=Dreissena polymorpha TaxID=45954 RepID=A0A9D4NHM3_DREPO|nr:hypothetical protein DPMN_019051 [Dreissena polymorpha]
MCLQAGRQTDTQTDTQTISSGETEGGIMRGGRGRGGGIMWDGGNNMFKKKLGGWGGLGGGGGRGGHNGGGWVGWWYGEVGFINMGCDQQTGQKQYVPHYYSGGHKKWAVGGGGWGGVGWGGLCGLSSDNHLVDGPTDRQTDRHEQSNIPPLLRRGS